MTSIALRDQIRSLAAQAGLSVSEVCRRAGVDRATVTHYKGKTSNPRLSTLNALAAAIYDAHQEKGLGTSKDSIFDSLAKLTSND